jgi:HAMP domain-containing protein
MTVLITIYLARRVVRPVRRTAMTAERLAAGALDARVPATSTAEVGVLERAFNSMAESLQHHVGELARLSDEQAALRRRCIAWLSTTRRPAAPTGVVMRISAGQHLESTPSWGFVELRGLELLGSSTPK